MVRMQTFLTALSGAKNRGPKLDVLMVERHGWSVCKGANLFLDTSVEYCSWNIEAVIIERNACLACQAGGPLKALSMSHLDLIFLLYYCVRLFLFLGQTFCLLLSRVTHEALKRHCDIHARFYCPSTVCFEESHTKL